MARTTTMRLIELMVLREDIHSVLKYLGELGEFQFQQEFASDSAKRLNPDASVFERLQQVRAALDLPDLDGYKGSVPLPSDADFESATKIIDSVEDIHKKELTAVDEEKRAVSAYREALAFANLKVSYSDLESLSFLTLRIGKIDPEKIDDLKARLGSRGIIVRLGDDDSRILAASSKKARFALDG